MKAQFITAFTEDVMAIEAVQAGMERFPDRPTVNISADGGGIRARRILDDMIVAERGVSSRTAE